MLNRWFKKAEEKEDPLAEELRRLEAIRASLEKKSSALKEEIESPHSHLYSARFARPSSSRQNSFWQAANSPALENASELKAQTRAARNRFIISCIFLVLLGLIAYKVMLPLIW